MPTRVIAGQSYRRFVVDRALGERAPARQRLQAIVDRPVRETGPAPRAYATSLLAVMSREDGDLPRAGQLLAQAWAIVVEETRHSPYREFVDLAENAEQMATRTVHPQQSFEVS